jgi:hypothetical protein
MVQKKNPLKLNPLQLRTLTLLQAVARIPEVAEDDPETGGKRISRFPRPHGDHFHLGDAVVSSSDATGLQNQAVWNALERKGLARADWPAAITLLPEGLSYDTEMTDLILHRATH